MKKQKKHIFGKICLLFAAVLVIAAAGAVVLFVSLTKDVHLSVEALKAASEGASIEIFYSDGTKMDTLPYFSLGEKINVNRLQEHTKNAFIATEDKRFYSHRGIDVRRMVGAMVSNIKNRKFSEGASTISQQLIKNTHLSREKTIKRKVQEIKLAMELEKKFSKDEILEMYLSSIYFGNGCYGISKAADFYFNKDPYSLSLGESAMLAAVINAPSVYDPISKNQNAEKRKNLVLKNMLAMGFIDEDDYQKNAKSHEKIEKSASKPAFWHIKPILSETAKRLSVSQSKLKNTPYKIYTSINKNLSESALNALENCRPSGDFLSAMVVIDNRTKNVVAFCSNSKANQLFSYRQPGSTIKPIMVYAPALESGLIYPESIIVDEPISIGGYSPKNAGGNYAGRVSVRYAIEKSLNIPAVKTLSNLSIKRGKEFASRMGVRFEKDDNNLALALGGMTKGVTLKELADAYSAFASGGEFAESSLVSRIVDENGKVIFESHPQKSQVMQAETAFLINDMLKSVAKEGTAKRLNSLGFSVAAKTGTVGKSGSKDNTDAFCVAYTKDHTVVAWIGMDETPLPSSVNGSNYPTEMAKRFFMTADIPHAEFDRPSGVVTLDIDTRALDENKVELATEFTPVRFKRQAIFNGRLLPDYSTRANIEPAELTAIMEQGQKPTLEFLSEANGSYELLRENLKTNEKISLAQLNGTGEKISFLDSSAQTGQLYEYTLVSGESWRAEDSNAQKSSVRLMSF